MADPNSAAAYNTAFPPTQPTGTSPADYGNLKNDAPPRTPGTDPADYAPPKSFWQRAGERLVTVFDKPYAVAAHRRLEDREKAAKAAQEAKSNGLLFGLNFGSVDDMTIAGSPAPYSFPGGSLSTGGGFPTGPSAYSNRPSIQIVSRKPDGTTQQALPFRSFILHSVSGGDTEKVDVIETFGAPHVFASGRFMRRYNFSGSTRVTAINPTATGDGTTVKERRVSSYSVLQQFYEENLRCTIQAQRNQFTRITVDHEIFDGWILQFTPGRVSDSEGFATFSFSMVVFDRRFENKADITDVLGKYAPPAGGRQRFVAAAAKTELNHAVGAGTFSLSASKANARGSVVTSASAGLELNLTPDVTCEVKEAACLIHVTGPDGLQVSVGGKAINAGGALLPIGTHSVKVVVKDPVAYLSGLKDSGFTGSVASADFAFDNNGSSSKIVSKASLSASLDVNTNIPVTISKITLILGSAAPVSADASKQLVVPTFKVDSSYAGSVPYTIVVDLTGPDANLAKASGVVLSVSGARASANTLRNETTATGGEDATRATVITGPTLVGTPTATTLTCSGTWVLPATNPFKLANIAELDLALAFVVPNRSTVVRPGIKVSASWALPAKTKPIVSYSFNRTLYTAEYGSITIKGTGYESVIHHYAVRAVLKDFNSSEVLTLPETLIGSSTSCVSNRGATLIVSPKLIGDQITFEALGSDIKVRHFGVVDSSASFLTSFSPLFDNPDKIQ